jgi:hypothetical protein
MGAVHAPGSPCAGDGYQPTAEGPNGRNGIQQADLLPGDQRRGMLLFAVPVGARLRSFTIEGGALRVDLPVAASDRAPVPEYQPGSWPRLGSPQRLVRLHGEALNLTPLAVLDPTPATGGVRPGFRAYSVRLRVVIGGTQPWPLNPEHLVVLVDSTGQQWFPGFVTARTIGAFDPFRDQPGQQQTAWVTWEIPLQAAIVALQASSYPGEVWAWRL